MTDSSRTHEKSYSYGRSSGAKIEPCPHPLSDLNESFSMNRMSPSPTPMDSPDSSREPPVVEKIDVEVQTELTGKDIDRLLRLEEEYRALQLNESPSPLEEAKMKTTGRSDRLLLIGGATDSFSMKIEEFVPRNESWKETFEIPNEVEWMSAACASRGSSVFVIGEVDFEFSSKIGTLWRLETQRGLWEELPHLLTPRVNLCLVDLDSGLYALGGATGREALNTVERFDFYKEQWIEGPSMDKTRAQFGAVAAHGGIYAFGGSDDQFLYRSGEFLDPRQGAWRKLKKMQNAHVAFGCVYYKDAIYLIGGFPATPDNSVSSLSSSTDIFELRMQRWREGPELNHQRAWCAAAVLDSPCVIGGKSSLSGNESNAPMERLDFATETWIEIPAVECTGHRAFCSAVTVQSIT